MHRRLHWLPAFSSGGLHIGEREQVAPAKNRTTNRRTTWRKDPVASTTRVKIEGQDPSCPDKRHNYDEFEQKGGCWRCAVGKEFVRRR